MACGRVVVVSLEVSLPNVFGGGSLVGKGQFADGTDDLLQRVVVEMAQGDGMSWRCNVGPKRMTRKKQKTLTSLLEGEGVAV